MRYRILVAAGLIVAICSASAQADIIPFEVRWASLYGPAKPTYSAITSRDQWLMFWRSIKTDVVGGPMQSAVGAIPDIDFKRYTLIVAGAGKKSTGGYSISINSVVEERDAIRVTVVETTIGHNCAGSAISTSPFVGASIPATAKQVMFDIVTAETICK
jgi:hypothetical protein